MATFTGSIIAALLFQAASYYIFPVLIWIMLTRRLNVSWRFIGLGALTWFTALPFIIGVPLAATVVAGASDPIQRQIVWGVALSLTAGIVEETSRYIYYRRSATLRNPDNIRQAIVAGAGHGGIEALVLGIQFVLLPVIMVALFPQFVPAELRDAPFSVGYAVINGGARIALVMCHIGFTLMVWRAVSQQRWVYYLAAIVLHVLLDLLAFVLPLVMAGTDWVIWVFVAALLAWTVAQVVPVLYGRRRRELAVEPL